MKGNFRKFVLSLYKPVKSLTFIMIGCMIISQILDLVKQYIIKGIIDLPSMENFQTTDLYKTIIILLCVIVLELIFYYTSNITSRHHIFRKSYLIFWIKKRIPFLQIIIQGRYQQQLMK